MRPAVFAVLLLAAFPAAAGARSCSPPDSHTLAKSRDARVYYIRGEDTYRTFGCLFDRGVGFALDDHNEDGYDESYADEPFALAGPYVAYEWAWYSGEPYEAGFFRVVVVDLRDGRTTRTMGAWGGHGERTYEEGFHPEVVRVRVRADGAAAWISDWLGDREVRRIDSRGGHRLDHGRHIPGKSLRIDGRRVYWTSDGARRHASLR